MKFTNVAAVGDPSLSAVAKRSTTIRVISLFGSTYFC